MSKPLSLDLRTRVLAAISRPPRSDRSSEQTIVADAMEAARQHVQEKAADQLGRKPSSRQINPLKQIPESAQIVVAIAAIVRRRSVGLLGAPIGPLGGNERPTSVWQNQPAQGPSTL